MNQVNILEAKNTLSQLVKAAERGEDVVIANRGTPVVRLVAVQPATHSGEAAAQWLTLNHPNPTSRRSAAELDQQIAAEREGWD